MKPEIVKLVKRYRILVKLMGNFYHLRPSNQAQLSFWKRDFTQVIKMNARIATMKSSALQYTLAIFNNALKTLPFQVGQSSFCKTA